LLVERRFINLYILAEIKILKMYAFQEDILGLSLVEPRCL